MSPVILVDCANIGFAAAAGKHALSAGDLDTTAIFGFLQTIRRIAGEFRGQITVLHDGKSWRHAECASYKEGRHVSDDAKALRERWVAAKPYVARLLPLLGVNQLLAPNLEADDLAARLRRGYVNRGQSVLLISGDKDWLQLVEPGVQVVDTIRERRVSHHNFQEVTGVPTPLAWAERKALMGKTMEMPGVGGIGEKTAVALLNQYGSVSGFLNVMATESDAYAKADRRARSLVDDFEKQERFKQNMRLAWLDHPDSPRAENPKAVKGQFNREVFLDLAAELAFFSIVRGADNWLQPFCRKDK